MVIGGRNAGRLSFHDGMRGIAPAWTQMEGRCCLGSYFCNAVLAVFA